MVNSTFLCLKSGQPSESGMAMAMKSCLDEPLAPVDRWNRQEHCNWRGKWAIVSKLEFINGLKWRAWAKTASSREMALMIGVQTPTFLDMLIMVGVRSTEGDVPAHPIFLLSFDSNLLQRGRNRAMASEDEVKLLTRDEIPDNGEERKARYAEFRADMTVQNLISICRQNFHNLHILTVRSSWASG